MDTQTVEIIGRNYLVSRLVSARLEVARPERDRGVDLIACVDLGEADGGLGDLCPSCRQMPRPRSGPRSRACSWPGRDRRRFNSSEAQSPSGGMSCSTMSQMTL